MSLFCFGISHRSAPISLLEKVAFSPPQMEQFLVDASNRAELQELTGLSTCNRTEFYGVGADAEVAARRLLELIAENRQGVSIEDLLPHLFLHRDDVAATHLFRVAAGVDSLVVGEAQILGQIRRAFELSNRLGTSGELLQCLLTRAISFGRRVRVDTGIGRGNISMASVACHIAQDVMGDLSTKKLLLLGAGETAMLAGRHFVKEGIGELFVLSRTQENARAMAAELGGKDIPIDHFQSAIEMADIMVCAVGATHYIVTQEGLANIMSRRPNRAQLIVDLSMPRNIDPACAQVPGVTLYAIENLEDIAAENRRQREAEIACVEQLITKETLRFLDWQQSSSQNKLISAFRRQTDEIRRQRIDRFCNHLPAEDLEQIERFTDSLLRAVFHDVTVFVRDLNLETEEGRRDYETVRRMFNLHPATMDFGADELVGPMERPARKTASTAAGV